MARLTAAPSERIAQSRDGRVRAQAFGDGGQDRLGRPLALKPHADCRYVAVSPDGRWIATGAHIPASIKVWDGRTDPFVKAIDKPGIGRVAFSPDGWWMAYGGSLRAVGSWGDLLGSDSEEGVILLYETRSGRVLARIADPNQNRGVYATFSPDGMRLVATNNDGKSVHVWDLRRRRRAPAATGLDWEQPSCREPDVGPAPRSEAECESEADGARRVRRPG